MKSLALYIDKWYIVGALSVDGNTRPVKLPNNEDRIWLFFHEDIANDTVSYGKGFKSHFWNRENHYYGDVFSNLTNSSVKFTMFKHQQPIKDIFKMAKVFDDLKAVVDNDDNIPTYLSFSKDITASARLIFRNELEQEGFQIMESVARIEHLALEFAVKKNGYTDEGYYLVLNAYDENLFYSIYKKSGDIFLRMAENVLIGMGTDVRRRCLIEHIIDSINQTERFLQTKTEKEAEYLRCSQFADDWILKISNANLHIPVQITDVTLSKDPHKTYSVTVKRKQIDEKTEVISKNLVDEIARFVRENGLRHEELLGIVFLGNTFTNKQFTSQFLNHYNLRDNRMVCYMDKDLSLLMSAYNFIDCSQFKEQESKFTVSAEDELRRLHLAEEERAANEKARQEAETLENTIKAQKEEEAKFRQAMDKGYESESNHDYENMVEFFEIAKNLYPDNEEAANKYEEALRLKAEETVILKTFKKQLQQAKYAFDDKDWELAKQKAEEALSSNSESKEARRIKEEAIRQISQQKDFDRYIDRADLFIAKKLYKEATSELEKARLLSLDDSSVKSRLEKIKNLKNAFKTKIDHLVKKLNASLNHEDYKGAISFCNELRQEDSSNQIKWSNRLSEIKILEQKEIERSNKIKSLKSGIDTAQWNDDWKTVVEKCQQLLAISLDDAIKEKLAVAQERLKVIEEKSAIEHMISDIKDLIVRADFKEAKVKLDMLSKGYLTDQTVAANKVSTLETSKTFGYDGILEGVGKFISKASYDLLPSLTLVNEPDIQAKIRELRKLLFERESEFESKHAQSSALSVYVETALPREKTPIQSKSKESGADGKKKSDDFFSDDSSNDNTKNKSNDKSFDFFHDNKSKDKSDDKSFDFSKNQKSKRIVTDFLDDSPKIMKNVSAKTNKKEKKDFDDFFN